MAGNDYVNLFFFTYDVINAIKKKDLVDYIKIMKGKVVAMIIRYKAYVLKLRIYQIMLKAL